MLTSGCSQQSGSNPISEFQKKHPEDAKMFVHIYPVNLDLFREMVGGRALAIQRLAKDLKQEFGNIQGVKEFVEQKEHEDRESRNKEFSEFDELKRLSENGGLVCEYEWNNKEESEVGLLVLKNGDIIKRDEWIRKIVNPAQIKRIDGQIDALEKRLHQQ